MQTYWEAVAGSEVLRKSWDGETAIYHTGSGDTQLLDTIGIAILNLIQTQATSKTDILEHIKRELDTDVDESALVSMLDELSRSGIISRFQA